VLRKIFVIFILLFLCLATDYVECFEVRIISPIGAVARSSIPGWGQFYTGDKIQGIIVFLSIGILGSLSISEDSQYRHFYNDFYRDAVYTGSPKASYYFDKANEHYKLSRFFIYTAGGIWAYSAIDAYIDAHIYNAHQQVKMLSIDDKRIQPLKIGDE